MGETILKLTPLIIGSAVVPLQIIIVILLLNSPRQGLFKALCLVAGMTVIRLAQGVVFGLLLSPGSGDTGGNSLIYSTLLLVLGILLLITAYKQWRNEADPDEPPPKWMGLLDSLTLPRIFGIGAGLVLISGKFWVFTLSAIEVIAEAQLEQPSSAAAFLLFVLLAQSLLILVILVRIILPARSRSMLGATSAWLIRNNRPIIVAVSLVFGVVFFIQGVAGLV
jgi:hypothetical protein